LRRDEKEPRQRFSGRCDLDDQMSGGTDQE
jgi:hypothetical protein